MHSLAFIQILPCSSGNVEHREILGLTKLIRARCCSAAGLPEISKRRSQPLLGGLRLWKARPKQPQASQCLPQELIEVRSPPSQWCRCCRHRDANRHNVVRIVTEVHAHHAHKLASPRGSGSNRSVRAIWPRSGHCGPAAAHSSRHSARARLHHLATSGREDCRAGEMPKTMPSAAQEHTEEAVRQIDAEGASCGNENSEASLQ